MKTIAKVWGRVILPSGIIYLAIFLAAVAAFSDVIVVDPAYHHISYENWIWCLDVYKSPAWWDLTSDYFFTAEKIVNFAFRLLFHINLAYIFIKREQFLTTRKAVVLTVAAIAILDTVLHYYIRFYVDFYRMYMYGTGNAMFALYMVYCGLKRRKALKPAPPLSADS